MILAEKSLSCQVPVYATSRGWAGAPQGRPRSAPGCRHQTGQHRCCPRKDSTSDTKLNEDAPGLCREPPGGIPGSSKSVISRSPSPTIRKNQLMKGRLAGLAEIEEVGGRSASPAREPSPPFLFAGVVGQIQSRLASCHGFVPHGGFATTASGSAGVRLQDCSAAVTIEVL